MLLVPEFGGGEIFYVSSSINFNLPKYFRFRFFSPLNKGFSFVEKDLSEKEEILHELCVADPTHYDTVNNMLSWECRLGTPSETLTMLVCILEPKENFTIPLCSITLSFYYACVFIFLF